MSVKGSDSIHMKEEGRKGRDGNRVCKKSGCNERRVKGIERQKKLKEIGMLMKRGGRVEQRRTKQKEG